MCICAVYSYLSHQIRIEIRGAKEFGGLLVGDLCAGGLILIATAAEEQVAVVAGLRLGQFQVIHFHVIGAVSGIRDFVPLLEGEAAEDEKGRNNMLGGMPGWRQLRE